MRLRSLFALTAPVLLVLPGCTSDLPAPTNYIPIEPPRPPNELLVECATLPLGANSATYEYTPDSDGYMITGQLEDATYTYSVDGELPEGITLDPATGAFSGLITAEAGTYTFAILIEDTEDPEEYSARGECTLEVRPRLNAPLALDTVPFCLGMGDDMRNLVLDGTGDGTEIVCDAPGGNGNGRIPNGITVVATDDVDSGQRGCTITGTIDEDRLGTWVFAMRGVQSGREVYVPYCVTNDEPQGYDITGTHSGIADATLVPIMQTYDPSAPFEFGVAMDPPPPRYEVTSPGICGNSCFYRYSFLRTNAPIEGYDLAPDGLVNDSMDEPIGFFHGLQVDGPAVPPEFVDRPWILSTNVSYCISADQNGCDDVGAASQGALEFGFIMVPN